MDRDYVFDRNADDGELARLRLIEQVFDPATRRRLAATGLAPGWRCLEVGPGAGSIMTWLCDQVGGAGHVTALDINPRFVAADGRVNLTIVQGDVCAPPAALAPASFDLIHARYVLIHVAEPERALDALVACLRPGGWLVVEEPDFTVARALAGAPADRAALAAVVRASLGMFAGAGKDGGFGARLPAMFAARPLVELGIENDAPIAPGGTAIATMMGMSTASLRARYVGTGLAGDDAIDGFLRLAADPASWAIYYATIAAIARTPG